MTTTPPSPHPYADFIHRVAKPARYMGGEYNAIEKAWSSVDLRFALCFPDLYDIGMSHMGTKILYSIVNKADDLLMERCFAPWFDMEEELRARDLPLLSLESHRPLRDFDVVGFSLQFELTYTNILTMLDLGGVPLRNADRTLDDPFVIAGGPTATHAEPMAPFIDAFLIGDAEERLPRLLRHVAQLKARGDLSRLEILAALAAEGGLYCPDLYEVETCERSGLQVVGAPKLPGVPARVERAFLDDISRYRFPSDSPVAVAEAIFDRMSVEIARGCTEGCRFCQAGMIYRPVRERDPEEIIETVLGSLEQGGYDQASITSLSTADYSCISPLIKTLMERLRERKVSLSISSLRAYGLDDDLLDDIASVKATGLTFAPEAGTQRMRDVINKNITEDDIFQTCHRVFSKGWSKMKLYFIIGLPTEEDEDVVGIAEMGRQALAIGHQYHKRGGVQVTVSVSSHVPKPHTPFQWVAMDSLAEIERKQQILDELSRRWRFKFRRHDARTTYLEGVLCRGDRRSGWLIEEAWRNGARFDSWNEKLRWDVWQEAITAWEAHHGLDHAAWLGTLPTDARLPWDHIDVGLAEGFLRKEHKKALKNRLSPPCGKPVGAKVHHTNLEDAHGDQRKLVCYHCGVACDLTQMREERIDFLERLGATTPPGPRDQLNARESAQDRVARGLTPHDFNQGQRHRVRLRYTKIGPVTLQGHLDLVRIFPRLLRRAGIEAWYSQGFHPKPIMSFGPALGLGARALSEYVDLSLVDDLPADDILARVSAVAPFGLFITGARRLGNQDKAIGKIVNALEYMVTLPDGFLDPLPAPLAAIQEERPELITLLDLLRARCQELMAADAVLVKVLRKRKERTLDLRSAMVSLDAQLSDAVSDHTDIPAGRLGLRFTQRFGSDYAALRPVEVIDTVLGLAGGLRDTIRVGTHRLTDDGDLIDPLSVGLTDTLDGPIIATRPLGGRRLRRHDVTPLSLGAP